MSEPRILSRDEFLALQDDAPRVFQSKFWGCQMKYRLATVGDKAAARQRAMVLQPDGKMTLDNERLEAALVVRCLIEPRLEPQDLEAVMNKNGEEIRRLSAEILGKTANPQ